MVLRTPRRKNNQIDHNSCCNFNVQTEVVKNEITMIELSLMSNK